MHLSLSPIEVLKILAPIFKACMAAPPGLTAYWLGTSNYRFILALKQIQALAQYSAEDRMKPLIRLILGYTPTTADGMFILLLSQDAQAV